MGAAKALQAGGRTQCVGLGPSSARCPAASARVDREELLGLQGPPWAALQGSGDLLLSQSLQISPGKDQAWNLMDLTRHFPLGVVSGPAGRTVAVEGSSDPPGPLASLCRTELSLPMDLCRAGPWGCRGGLGTVESCRASKSGKAEGALPWLLKTGTTAQIWRERGLLRWRTAL